MKKLFIAAMALATIVSCSKDDAGDSVKSSMKNVTVKINNFAQGTRHLTDAADVDDLVCATSSTLTIVFTDGGNLVKEFTLNEGDNTANGGSGEYTFHALPESVDGFFVIGSKKATIATPATQTAAEKAWMADQEDDEWVNIVVYGVSENWTQVTDCGEDGYAHYTADVTVAPYKARVEVSAITCDDLGALNRDDNPATLGYEKVTVTSFGLEGTTAQTLTENNVMTAGDAAVTSLTPATGKVWSWNIDPDATSSYLLTLNATVNAEPYYTVSSAYRTIKATKYTSGSEDLTQFASGHIYKMTIPFSESDLDDETSLICVTANVTIDEWVVVDDVKPVFGN